MVLVLTCTAEGTPGGASPLTGTAATVKARMQMSSKKRMVLSLTASVDPWGLRKPLGFKSPKGLWSGC